MTPYTLGQIRNGAAQAKLYQIGPVFFAKKGGSICYSLTQSATSRRLATAVTHLLYDNYGRFWKTLVSTLNRKREVERFFQWQFLLGRPRLETLYDQIWTWWFWQCWFLWWWSCCCWCCWWRLQPRQVRRRIGGAVDTGQVHLFPGFVPEVICF